MLRAALITLLLLSSTALASTDATELFDKGNRFYEARQYDSAIVSYAEALATGQESASLYFNLGNAYFKSGDLGHAVLYYLRAQRLEPNDDDIEANLEFAKRYASVQMEGVKLNPISSFFETIVAPYKLDLLAWVASACFILLFLALTVRYGLGRQGLLVRAAITSSATLLVVSSLLTTVKYNVEFLTERAVIVAENCGVRTGPSLSSEVELD